MTEPYDIGDYNMICILTRCYLRQYQREVTNVHKYLEQALDGVVHSL